MEREKGCLVYSPFFASRYTSCCSCSFAYRVLSFCLVLVLLLTLLLLLLLPPFLFCLHINVQVEVWCTGNNVPGAWLEAKVKKVRGLKFDVGKVLAGGTLWVEREKVRLVWKRSAEVHSRSLIGFTTRSLFPTPRRLMHGAAAATNTAHHPHASSSSSHSPSIHVAPMNVHHSTRASPPGGGQYINGPRIGAQQHRQHHQHHHSSSGGGSGNNRDRSGSGSSARSLVFGGLRRSPQSSSSSSSTRTRHSSSINTPITLAPVEHNNNRRRNSATSNLSTSTNNSNSQRRSNQGSFQVRSPSAAAAAAPTVGLNRRVSSASALGSNSSSRSPGENRLRIGSDDGQRRHTHSESRDSSSSISDDDDDDNEESTAASILRDHPTSPLPLAPSTASSSSPTSHGGSNHPNGANRILHAARKLNTSPQELYGYRGSDTTTSSGSDQDEGDGFANVNGVSQSSRAAAAAEEDDDDDEIDGTLSHYDEAALADEEAMLRYWQSQRNVVRSSRASSAHTYPLRNTHSRSSAGGRTESASPALTAADQRYARQAAAAIAAEQWNPHSGVASQEGAGAGAPVQSQATPTARRRLSVQNALWPFVWKSRSSRQRRESTS